MVKLIEMKKQITPSFWLGVFLYPYLHCWLTLNTRGKSVDRYV